MEVFLKYGYDSRIHFSSIFHKASSYTLQFMELITSSPCGISIILVGCCWNFPFLDDSNSQYVKVFVSYSIASGKLTWLLKNTIV